MNPILESLPNLVGYSVPTILVIGGLVLFFLPFFKDMQPAQMRSARIYGVITGVIGIGLALLIKPTEPQPQLMPVYILPTPVSVSPPGGSTEPTALPTSPSVNIPAVQATATEPTVAEQPIATEIPPSPTIPILPSATATPEPVTSVIPVWAIEENGVQVNISTSGVYNVAYLGDAYSPWPSEQYEGYRGWTTIVKV